MNHSEACGLDFAHGCFPSDFPKTGYCKIIPQMEILMEPIIIFISLDVNGWKLRKRENETLNWTVSTGVRKNWNKQKTYKVNRIEKLHLMSKTKNVHGLRKEKSISLFLWCLINDGNPIFSFPSQRVSYDNITLLNVITIISMWMED